MTSPISVPAGYAPAYAVGYSDRGGGLALVSDAAPLPVATTPLAPEPLAGSISASAIVGPFDAVAGRVVSVALDGEWEGTATPLRSMDAGTTTDGDTTPSVDNSDNWYWNNPAAPIAVTQFDDGLEGQTITVWTNAAQVTIRNNANIVNQNLADRVLIANRPYSYQKRFGIWYEMPHMHGVNSGGSDSNGDIDRTLTVGTRHHSALDDTAHCGSHLHPFGHRCERRRSIPPRARRWRQLQSVCGERRPARRHTGDIGAIGREMRRRVRRDRLVRIGMSSVRQ